MAAGIALILASPLDLGATAVAGIALIGAASGLISAGIALEEQFAKEGRIKVDSRLALNLVTIATSLVGLSEIRGAFTTVRQLSRGVAFAKIGFNLGATGIQAAVVYQQVQDELNALEAQYKPRLLSMDPNSAEYKTLEREYKSKVAQIMGAAAANGTFMLVAFGQGVHGLAELPAPGMMSGKNFSVHEDVIDLGLDAVQRDPRSAPDREPDPVRHVDAGRTQLSQGGARQDSREEGERASVDARAGQGQTAGGRRGARNRRGASRSARAAGSAAEAGACAAFATGTAGATGATGTAGGQACGTARRAAQARGRGARAADATASRAR